MNGIIVRACAIIASLIALYAPGAFALSIDTGIIGKAGVSETLTSAPDAGYMQTTGYGIPAGTGGFTSAAMGSGSMIPKPAAGLFAGDAGEGAAQSCYVDPSTLCVTAAGIGSVGFPGLVSDERICRGETCRTSMPVPGTMLIVGLCLLGLSSLKKRDPRTIPLARRASRSGDGSFFPARIHAVEARAAEGRARVVPISATLHQRSTSRETEKYRAVMKMKHQSPDLRKEMAG